MSSNAADAALFPLPDVGAGDPDPVIGSCPVGSRVDVQPDGRWGLATATFDASGTYRYRLSRVWAEGPRVNFLMLNPSTADAFQLDPTVNRCVRFAQRWQAGALEVTNAFALRSTDPAGLRKVDDPVGPGNDEAILAAARAADLLVVAWGVHATWLDREQRVRQLLDDAGIQAHCLRVTKDGHPGHPLYVPADTVLRPWPA